MAPSVEPDNGIATAAAPFKKTTRCGFLFVCLGSFFVTLFVAVQERRSFLVPFLQNVNRLENNEQQLQVLVEPQPQNGSSSSNFLEVPQKKKQETTTITSTDQSSTKTVGPSNSKTNNRKHHNNGLYIHVVEWAEGMAAWRTTFTEILTAAKTLNATLVEPCVANGRLCTCRDVLLLKNNNSTSSYTNTILRLGDIYDLTPAKRYHSKLVSYEQFVHDTYYTGNDNVHSTNLHYLCLLDHKKASNVCGRHNVQATKGKARQPGIERALQAAANNTRPVVLEVLTLGKNALSQWIHTTTNGLSRKGVDATMVARIRDLLLFPQKEFDRVRAMLATLGISNTTKFAAIQYRPELKGLNYTFCAQQLLETRQIIRQTYGIEKNHFLLLSPLSLQKRLQWAGVAALAEHDPSSHASLVLLRHQGFHKLEDVFDDTGEEAAIPDGAMLAVWDMILAMTATVFTTCFECNTNKLCHRCNYQGAASHYALQLRNQEQRRQKQKQHQQQLPSDQRRHDHKMTTQHCWPQL